MDLVEIHPTPTNLPLYYTQLVSISTHKLADTMNSTQHCWHGLLVTITNCLYHYTQWLAHPPANTHPVNALVTALCAIAPTTSEPPTDVIQFTCTITAQ